MVDKWIFCALDRSLNKQSFDCGVVELNDYLYRYASQNHRKGIATTFVAVASADDRQIAKAIRTQRLKSSLVMQSPPTRTESRVS
jgi:hypothetical protein